MRRVVVHGSSGSGKTTLAAELADRLGVPHVELDALFHLPDWQQAPTEQFRAAVAAATAGDGWVVDGNYGDAVPVVRARADTLVVLDLPKALVMRRLLWRTIRRGALRRELWNGNREELRNLARREPEDNVVLWAWTTFERRHQEAVDAPSDPAWSHADVVVLTTPAEVAAFVEEVDASTGR